MLDELGDSRRRRLGVDRRAANHHILNAMEPAAHEFDTGNGELQPPLSVDNARRLREYIAENFARKLSVAELAAICNLTPNHFIHAFIRTFGKQPHRYLIGLRLELAEKLLLESNLPYSSTASMSGFSSQSHLTSTMRKYKHTTPVKIRLIK